jgi:hypothetical protein
MQNTAQIIIQLVKEACHHGSTNLGESKEAHEKVWIILIESFTQMHAKLQNSRHTIEPQDQKILEHFFTQHCNVGVAMYDWQKKISHSNRYVSPEIDKLVEHPLILRLIHKYCPLKFNKEQFMASTPEVFWPIIANELSEILFKREQEDKPKNQAEMMKLLLSEMALLQKFEKGQQFTGEDIEPFIVKTLKDVEHTVYTCGFGNCALMNDAAFLWAIHMNTLQDVHYLRIRCRENPAVDVINFVAIGTWPQPGCLLIVPWGGHGVIEWQGSIEKTPALTRIDRAYNDILTLCALNPKQQKHVQSLLKKSGFERFKDMPKRQVMHDNVQTWSAKLHEQLQEIACNQDNYVFCGQDWKHDGVTRGKVVRLSFASRFFQGSAAIQGAGKIVATEEIVLNHFPLQPGAISPRTSGFFNTHNAAVEADGKSITLIGGTFTEDQFSEFRRTRNVDRLTELTQSANVQAKWKFTKQTSRYWIRVPAAAKEELQAHLRLNELRFQLDKVKNSEDYCLQIEAAELVGEKERPFIMAIKK